MDIRLRQAAKYPKSFLANYDASHIALFRGDARGARRYHALAAAALIPRRTDPNQLFRLGAMRLFEAVASWLDKPPAITLKLTNDAAAVMDTIPPEEQLAYGGGLVSLYLALGRLNQAQEIAAIAQRQQPRGVAIGDPDRAR